MAEQQRYADFISINKNFKDVFSLEADIDKDSLWKRFYFTKAFGELLSDLNFLFSNEFRQKRKGIVITGTYGVGKSHATAVVSHLLWDETSQISDFLDQAAIDLGTIGLSIKEFRKSKRYFPVILTGSDSTEIFDSNSFELRLQVALERSLKKYGFYDTITERTAFEKYQKWLESLVTNENRKNQKDGLIQYLNKLESEFNFNDLIDALKANNNQALQIIKQYFFDQGLKEPFEIDTKAYYKNILQHIRKIDPSITGIIIYWDEFTTIFHNIGYNNDRNLIKNIEEWAEFAYVDQNSSDSIVDDSPIGIFLLLVSHISPKGLIGKYRSMEGEFGKINDRFIEKNFEMDKLTTYHLISESLLVKDRSSFRDFLTKRGLNDKKFDLIGNVGKDLFPLEFTTDHLEKTIPFHYYSVYIAGKLADLVGSSERSIFNLIHSTENNSEYYGDKVGFSSFITKEPSNDGIVWYETHQVFDFFYNDLLSYFQEPSTEQAVLRPLEAFKESIEAVKRKGPDALKVYKTIVLMEMLYAKTHESLLNPTKTNLYNVFLNTTPKLLDPILTKLIDDRFIIDTHDERSGNPLYRTNPGSIDSKRRIEIEYEIKNKIPFKKFILENEIQEKIKTKFRSTLLNSPRISNNFVDIYIIPAIELDKYRENFEKLDGKEKAVIYIIVPADNNEYLIYKEKVQEYSKKFLSGVFSLYEGEFSKNYSRWISAYATLKIEEERKSTAGIKDAQKQIDFQIDSFISNFSRLTVFFRGNSISKNNGPGSEIKNYLEQIYYKGFDYLVYDQFWKNPKAYAKVLLQKFGQEDALKEMENEQYLVKKILEVFKDKEGADLINNKLDFKEKKYVESAPLYEIIQKIRSTINQKTGHELSIKNLIDELKIEKIPYGLCGWMESIIFTYALTVFYHEGRLEVKSNNHAFSKEAADIINAINRVIKDKDDSFKIKVGKEIENKLANKLNQIFSLNAQNQTLFSIVTLIREKIQNEYKLPIWLSPYSEQNLQSRSDLSNCIDKLSVFIREYTTQSTEEHFKYISDCLRKIEMVKTPAIWGKIFAPNYINESFKSYIIAHNWHLLDTYQDLDEIKRLLYDDLQQDVWLWKEIQVSETLAKLDTNRNPPYKPENFTTNPEKGGISLTWSVASNDSPKPTEYLIERKLEGETEFKLLKTVLSNTTCFFDSQCDPGVTYHYRIFASNPKGLSESSEISSVFMLKELPQIGLSTKSQENAISVSWNKPEFDNHYKITGFILYRGINSDDLEEIVSFSGTDNQYLDYSLQPGIPYYYQIEAVNCLNQKKKGIISRPTLISKKEPPAPPRNFVVNLMKRMVQIKWNYPETGIDSVDSFTLTRKDLAKNQDTSWALNSNTIEYFDNSVINGREYQYCLIAKNIYGESAEEVSGKITIPFEIPAFKIHLSRNSECCTISWDKFLPELGIRSISILRRKSSGQFEIIKELSENATEFVDSEAVTGIIYVYRVTIKNDIGEEKDSSNDLTFAREVAINVDDWKEQTESFIRKNPANCISLLKSIITKIDVEFFPKKNKEEFERIKTALEAFSDD